MAENGKAALPQKAFEALVTAGVVTIVMFVFSLFDDSRRGTATVQTEMRVLAEQVKTLAEQQKDMTALLQVLRSNETRTQVLEQRLTYVEQHNQEMGRRVAEQLRDIATQVSNLQQSIARERR